MNPSAIEAIKTCIEVYLYATWILTQEIHIQEACLSYVGIEPIPSGALPAVLNLYTCTIELRYNIIAFFVRPLGLEPRTHGLKARCSTN